jgi:hypothetical protein
VTPSGVRTDPGHHGRAGHWVECIELFLDVVHSRVCLSPLLLELGDCDRHSGGSTHDHDDTNDPAGPAHSSSSRVGIDNLVFGG